MTTSKSSAKNYENNPFFVAIQGIELLFNNAKSVGIALLVLMGIGFLTTMPYYFTPIPSEEPTSSQSSSKVSTSTLPSTVTPNTLNTTEEYELTDEDLSEVLSQIPVGAVLVGALLVLLFVTIALLIGFFIQGVLDYTSVQIAAGKTVTLSEAARTALQKFWGFAWVMTIAGVKTFLWTLLFIIPGIYMTYRYSLAGLAYFDGKKGNDAVKHSLALTRSAWLTTFASQSLLEMLTLGATGALFSPGSKAVLYRQYSMLEKKNEPKPPAHILSWLTLVIPIVFLLLSLLLIGLILAAVSNYLSTAA